MIDDELAANTSLTWMLRAGGWFMMFMGLYMMTSFINYLGEFIRVFTWVSHVYNMHVMGMDVA